MKIETQTLTGEVQGALLRPDAPSGLGIIVLTGSSGRVDVDRARLFAERGAVVLAEKWWGGEGQAPGINHIPLEVFVAGIDRLKAEGCARIAMLGTSNGAQATLLTAVRDPRVDVAIAISPTLYVWQNFGPGLDAGDWPPRSAFTWQGKPLPFIVWDPRAWPPLDRPRPSFRRLYEESLRTFAEDIPAATIPVEDARAEIILVAGAADALWPSDTAAHQIAARLAAHRKAATVIEHPDAGHSPIFPGEPELPEPMARAWGGTRAADRELGALAWAEIVRRLALEGETRA
jgi:dienelactone hydrolase